MGVGLGEHVMAVDLFEYLLGDVLGNTVGECALQEPTPVHGYEVVVVGSGEGAAYLVGLRGLHARHVGYQLHHLLLPYDDTAASFQGSAL